MLEPCLYQVSPAGNQQGLGSRHPTVKPDNLRNPAAHVNMNRPDPGDEAEQAS
jgi:hypothetical protein